MQNHRGRMDRLNLHKRILKRVPIGLVLLSTVGCSNSQFQGAAEIKVTSSKPSQDSNGQGKEPTSDSSKKEKHNNKASDLKSASKPQNVAGSYLVECGATYQQEEIEFTCLIMLKEGKRKVQSLEKISVALVKPNGEVVLNSVPLTIDSAAPDFSFKFRVSREIGEADRNFVISFESPYGRMVFDPIPFMLFVSKQTVEKPVESPTPEFTESPVIHAPNLESTQTPPLPEPTATETQVEVIKILSKNSTNFTVKTPQTLTLETEQRDYFSAGLSFPFAARFVSNIGTFYGRSDFLVVSDLVVAITTDPTKQPVRYPCNGIDVTNGILCEQNPMGRFMIPYHGGIPITTGGYGSPQVAKPINGNSSFGYYCPGDDSQYVFTKNVNVAEDKKVRICVIFEKPVEVMMLK